HYIRMPDLEEAWVQAADKPQGQAKLLKKYAAYTLLVIDEWLLDPPNETMRSMLLELLERRYDTASTVFCTQYAKKDWHQPPAPIKPYIHRPVGAGSFDAKRDDLPEPGCPLQQLSVTQRVRGDRKRRQDPADGIHHGSNVNMLMRVDADNDVSGTSLFDCAHGVSLPYKCAVSRKLNSIMYFCLLYL